MTRKVASPTARHVTRVAKHIHRTLLDERVFWDEMVRIMTGEETKEADVDRIVTVADRLVQHRRERYPVVQP